MDVRSIVDVEPEVEHNGTVPVWYLVHPREMKALTDGGHLELVNEFEVANGGYVYPHSHPTHEFYFVMSGRGVMTIDGEDRDVVARRLHLHPAGPRAQPAPDRRRRDPLLLLRGRGQGRARDRLHVALTSRRRGRAFPTSDCVSVTVPSGRLRSASSRRRSRPRTRRAAPTSARRAHAQHEVVGAGDVERHAIG